MIEYLDELGITGYLATNGQEALDMAGKVHPGLILLDLTMPGMDGIGFLERRAGNSDLQGIPVIITSAVGLADSIRRALQLGARDYIRKPITLDVLQRKLE